MLATGKPVVAVDLPELRPIAAAKLIDTVRPVLQNEARSFGLRTVAV